jgi:hypothetical protein
LVFAIRLNCCRSPDDLELGLAWLPQPLQFQFEPALMRGVVEHRGDLLDAERFLDKIERAQLGGLHRGLDGPVAGDDDHLRAVLKRNLLDVRQRLQAVHALQPHIEQHHVVAVARELFDALLAAFDRAAGVALVFKNRGQRLADSRLVVNDQHARGSHARASASTATAAGIST